VNSQKSPQIRLGDPNATAEAVRNEFAGRDSTSDRAGINAKHFRRLGDGEELDSVAPIGAAEAFRTTIFCVVTTRSLGASGALGHVLRPPELEVASRWAMNALMLAIVIFRDPPSL
jgi:hypothetical protein